MTGERTERTLQETASSVTVTTQDDLDAFAGPDTLQRIFNQTANVTTSGNGNQGPTIRGSNTSGVLTSLESFFGGSQPRTTTQVDLDKQDGDQRVWVSATCENIVYKEQVSGLGKVGAVNNAIHSSETFGAMRQPVILIVGFMLLLLTITGLIVWFKRYFQRRAG